MYSPTQVQRIRRRWCSTLGRDVAFSGPDADLVSAALGLQPVIGVEAQRPRVSHVPPVWWAGSVTHSGRPERVSALERSWVKIAKLMRPPCIWRLSAVELRQRTPHPCEARASRFWSEERVSPWRHS